ncbi:MAG: hypothetical protein CMA03_06015 [Euryarchaeota archaeon]|nr:hypothetical protein [Euryarchaeota archaeon]|tara:strand:- start:2858 stop:3148 length:291 start_codon:yes stop_codon:yes gene_type:complete
MESELLPRKFLIPIIILVGFSLLIPVGNMMSNSDVNDSDDEKRNRTVIIAIFSLSFTLAGLIVTIIVNNPHDFLNENKQEEPSISFTKREGNLDRK